jgi:hypothetical protein
VLSATGPNRTYREAAGQRDGGPVTEATDTAQRAEVVVEAAVLLHQDHHVLDVPDVTVPPILRC